MPYALDGTALCCICGMYATGWSKGQLVCPKHGGGNGSVLTKKRVEYQEWARRWEKIHNDLEEIRKESRETAIKIREEHQRRRKIELLEEIVSSSTGIHRKINERWLKSIEQ